MAISDDLFGVSVTVTVNGNALKEHIDPNLDEDERTTTRYIEAASGQTFAVSYTVQQYFRFAGDTLAIVISVDGKEMHAPLVFDATCRYNNFSGSSEGNKTADGTLRRFQFTDLETVSDGRVLNDEARKLKGLGTIEVLIVHKFRQNQIHESRNAGVTIEGGVVSEKALKGQALSHRVQLSGPEKTARPKIYHTIPVLSEPNPAARFVFKYRSAEALRAERIVPRTPTPPPLEDRDPTTLTADELRELQKRARAFRDEQESKIKIKRERHGDEPRRRKIARPSAGSTQLELDEEGRARASSTPTVTGEPEVIELD